MKRTYIKHGYLELYGNKGMARNVANPIIIVRFRFVERVSRFDMLTARRLNEEKSNLFDQMRTFSRIRANSHRFNAIFKSGLLLALEQLAFRSDTVIRD